MDEGYPRIPSRILMISQLQMLETWSNKWLLKFNPCKTRVVYFSRQLVSLHQRYFFKAISWSVPVHRHLGLLLSHNLIWSEYIFSKVEKAYKNLRFLKKIKVQNSKRTFVKIVNCIY